MQKIVLFILLLICGVSIHAQQPNYLYIEAEKGQPFYIKIKDKVQSSSAGGYAIISGLTEESYVISIGFPKNAFPEQHFSVTLNKNDKGYLLKNLGEKGWGLFDLQTMALITNANDQTASDTTQVKKTDAFSTLLSKVVNDPAVLIENKKPAEPLPKSPSPQMSPVGDSAAKNAKTAATDSVLKQIDSAARSAIAAIKSLVRKVSEQQKEETYEAVYIDASDTIRISYPIDKSVATAPPATPLTDTKEPEKPVAIKVANSDCKNFANEQDVDKLRVKILSQGDIDNKLSAAKKYFRTKCFTVKQIRALSELFTQDENKYQLFDIAYPFVSDTENFYQLEDGLESEYYKNRFKAMIKK